MECAEAKERLLDHREGQLDVEGQMHLEAHLLMCGRCHDEFQALDALLSAVAALPVPDPSPGFARRLHARIAQEKQRRSSGWRRRPQLTLALAGACLAFVLLVGGAVWNFSPPPTSSAVTEGSAALNGAVWNSLRQEEQEEVEVTRNLWTDMDPDWTTLSEKVDRRLASLALREEDLTEEVAGLWAPGLPGAEVMHVLVEISVELSDVELEALLVRMRG